MSTEGRKDVEPAGGKLWKSELWKVSGRAAQRYLSLSLLHFTVFDFGSACLSLLRVSDLLSCSRDRGRHYAKPRPSTRVYHPLFGHEARLY